MQIKLKYIILNVAIVCTMLVLLVSLLSKVTLAITLQDSQKHYLSRSVYSSGSLDMPKVLSVSDLDLYLNINKYQELGDYIKADELIKQLDNNILVGYFLYLRYVSKGYKTSASEIKLWLDKYKTLPISNVIYQIAKNKFPQASYLKTLQKPISSNFYAISIPFYHNHPLYTVKSPNIEMPPENPVMPYRLQSDANTKAINKNLKAGDNDGVAKILQNKAVQKKINQYTYYHYAATLSKAYFLDGNDLKAIIWAKQVVENMKEYFPEASFTLGLAYYRMQNYNQATEYFEYLAQQKSVFTTDIVAKGAYWHAKTNFVMGNYGKYIESLKDAATYIYNFYGLVANEELGIKPYYSFEYVNFEQTSVEKLQENTRSKRAFALLQMGLLDWAEQELILLANEIVNSAVVNVELLEALIYVAQYINMPALSLKLAGARGMYYGLSHLSYPVFLFDLDDDYSVDPALLLAFMRRESQFFSSASSHAGAKGLMQLLPQTASFVADKYKLDTTVDYSSLGLYSPKVNVKLGQKYVETLLDNPNTNGNLIAVLIGFNAGLQKGKPWFDDKFRRFNEDPLFFIESIPYYETRAYVKSVLTDYWVYQYKLNISRTSLVLLTRGYHPIYKNISAEELDTIKNFNYLRYLNSLKDVDNKSVITNHYQ